MDYAYANARLVLPFKLLRQLQRHFSGGLLWVPPPQRRRRKTFGNDSRNHEMLKAYRRGVPMSRLASAYGLSRERVRQILKSLVLDRPAAKG